MSNMEIKNWGDYGKPIPEKSIRENFPQPEYRVAARLYRANKVLIPGAARAGLFFVLNGKCKCSFGGDDGVSILLEAGQYINFPEGTYQIESLENQDAKIAFVWNIENYASRFLPITWVIF